MTADWLEDVADYLAAGGVGVVGTSIFTHAMPPQTTGLVLTPTGGAPHDRARSVESPSFQVMARAASPSAAYGLAIQAYNRLKTSQSVLQGSTYWQEARASQPPFPLSRDEAGQFLYACNYQLFGQKEGS